MDLSFIEEKLNTIADKKLEDEINKYSLGDLKNNDKYFSPVEIERLEKCLKKSSNLGFFIQELFAILFNSKKEVNRHKEICDFLENIKDLDRQLQVLRKAID